MPGFRVLGPEERLPEGGMVGSGRIVFLFRPGWIFAR
jgi:hypothetical protein